MSNVLIIKCKGEGRGSCKRCNDKGIWNRHWMSMLYEIKGYDGYYCWDCAKDIVKAGGGDERNRIL